MQASIDLRAGLRHFGAQLLEFEKAAACGTYDGSGLDCIERIAGNAAQRVDGIQRVDGCDMLVLFCVQAGVNAVVIAVSFSGYFSRAPISSLSRAGGRCTRLPGRPAIACSAAWANLPKLNAA